MKFIKLAFLLFLLVGGCATYKQVHYFSPQEGPEFKVAKSAENLLDRAIMPFEPNGELLIVINDYAPSHSELFCQITLPQNHQAQFLENTFKILTTENKLVTELVFNEIEVTYNADSGFRKNNLQYNQTLHGATVKNHMLGKDLTSHNHYTIKIQNRIDLPGEFYLQVPQIIINGKRTQPSNIKFIRKRGSARLTPGTS